MNTHEIDNLRNLASYLRIAFQRKDKIVNTCAVEMEHLPSVVSAFSSVLTMHVIVVFNIRSNYVLGPVWAVHIEFNKGSTFAAIQS